MRLESDDRASIGLGLSRPESVIATRTGDVFVSHRGAVAARIAPDGRVTPIGRPPGGVDFVPNGICLASDGALLVANVGADGGIWRLDGDHEPRPLLLEVDGVALEAANFVLEDRLGRLWITVSTRSRSRNDAYNRNLADGFIVVVEAGAARIVADGLAFTNELRLSDDGRRLFVCETAGARVTGFDVEPDGGLGRRWTLTTFDAGTFPDGCEFDAAGHLWVASVVSNRLIRVAPDGAQELVFEDSRPDVVAAVVAARTAGQIHRDHFYRDSARHVAALTSVAFGGADLSTVLLGSLTADRLVTFRSPVSGRVPEHWDRPARFAGLA